MSNPQSHHCEKISVLFNYKKYLSNAETDIYLYVNVFSNIVLLILSATTGSLRTFMILI